MIFQVRMLAFHAVGTFRPINIPDCELQETTQEDILNLIYKHGQNEIQNVPQTCSIAVGDVIEYDNKYFMVRPIGFKEITQAELDAYEALPQDERGFSEYARPASTYSQDMAATDDVTGTISKTMMEERYPPGGHIPR